MKQPEHENLYTEVLLRLRNDGSRVTRAREEIVEALVSAHDPVTVADLTRRVLADEASVYRTVERLKSLGLLEEVRYPDGTTRYALVLDHHHHIVCTNCGYTAHLACVGEIAPPAHPRFSEIVNHTITYYGLCTSCTTKNSCEGIL
jgi:Fe2+ or Zn2+ uptake regulation protein